MTTSEFIKKWNVAFEDLEQKREFAKEMRKDINSLDVIRDLKEYKKEHEKMFETGEGLGEYLSGL